MHASRKTHIAAGTTAGQVAADTNIIVYGILLEGTSAGQVTILDKANATLFLLSVGADDTNQMSIPFIADNGIRVTTPAGVTATVFHSQPGV